MIMLGFQQAMKAEKLLTEGRLFSFLKQSTNCSSQLMDESVTTEPTQTHGVSTVWRTNSLDLHQLSHETFPLCVCVETCFHASGFSLSLCALAMVLKIRADFCTFLRICV